MNNDDCTHGKNGCHALQEVQKDMVSLNTLNKEMSKDISKNEKTISDINKIILKQASVIGFITALIQLAFKFWK